jgi:hypothetical protein
MMPISYIHADKAELHGACLADSFEDHAACSIVSLSDHISYLSVLASKKDMQGTV